MENVKWLLRIEPVDAGFKGFWQRRGWQDTALIKTMSRIDIPVNEGVVPVDVLQIAGVAFAGKRGIMRVEVSVDDGETWRDADFEPSLSDYAWVIWRLAWPNPMPSKIAVLVRSTDGTGAVQIERKKGNQPSGATGYHRITVTLRKPLPTPDGTAG
jgi:hypothetical protein